MKPQSLETWIWTLIYGGLIVVALGVAVQQGDAALGWTMVTGGGIVAGVGAMLIYVRSRMEQPKR